MKAIVCERYGSAEVLRHTDVDQPATGDDEVLVRVRAVSINYGDRIIMHGSPPSCASPSGYGSPGSPSWAAPSPGRRRRSGRGSRWARHPE